MIGPVFAVDGGTLSDILSNTLVLLIIGMALAAGVAWVLARQAPVLEDRPHGALRHLPITPILLLGIFIIPYLHLNLVFSGILLAILTLPVLLLIFVRYNQAHAADIPYARLAQRAVLQSGTRKAIMPALVFLISGILYYAIVPGMRANVNDILPDVIAPMIGAVVVGGIIGVLLGLLRGRLAALLEARHHANQFSPVVDSPLGVLMSVLDGFLARFHGSPLVIVLAIGAAVLPFTTASQQIVLALVMLPPVASASMAAWMVDDPASGRPGVNQHIRTGLTGMVQICVGYLMGIAMLSPLADVREWMVTESDATMTALDRHLYLTFVALGLSVAIGVVAGIFSSRVEVLRIIFTFLGNIGRTVPSLAVLALALPIFGVGIQPSLVALVFIGTLPILVNTTVGIVEVSQDIKEAARGMGMNGLQVLLRVEIPVAAPVMMAGIRTSAVLVVASATLAAFIGGGGLGELIIRGQGSGQDQILFTGAILATILSILLEYLFGWLETVITPRGLRES